ncbi:MAG: glycine cleavage system protein H [Candidatus Handelsmanbacteria bacterium RIFCSPLOWO2_12_FULL_64_10]|uniref:Glycine cleavage system H protein n=1 Tax=Handelsmanbacteria sp. (strain RIFCSPLOWO2_12_FULL_64_10) TaxID=1817868 RepID=A0A1F6D4H4_HANXR|nr:MAG: glycine cleavage system protein H [Candidatus Handelsmanbacteria bacterium RIFCSPLOWO2_12_FULL_64_10]
MSLVPKELLYTDQHEWLLRKGEVATVGITDYAQHELGDIVFVELPKMGDRVSQGQPFGTVEAVKTVAELFAPVSGEVLEVNESLTEDAGQVNEDPYSAGWMIRVRIHAPDEVDRLMTPEEYEKMIQGL